jgi:DNA-binding LacI/PurR family transcriptional regulator
MPRRRAPTIVEVASRAGVSKSLVSLALRNSPNVSDTSRAAILRAAKELGYRPNAVARSLVSRRSYVLGVMLSDLSNPFFTEMVEGIEDAALAAGYRALINTGRRRKEEELVAIDTLLQLRTDGLILAAPAVGDDVVESAARVVPTVLATRAIRAEMVDNVVNDDRFGAQVAVDHLVSLGHRNIAHVTGGGAAGAQRRARGYADQMRRYGLGSYIRVVPGSYTEEGGRDGVRRLLASGKPPSAIFAPNDVAALGVMHALEAAGLAVPRDVSLIGYDDIALAGFGHINLTTIHQPRREIGRKSVELLLERIDQGRTKVRRILIKPSLVVRGTTAPPYRHAAGMR